MHEPSPLPSTLASFTSRTEPAEASAGDGGRHTGGTDDGGRHTDSTSLVCNADTPESTTWSALGAPDTL